MKRFVKIMDPIDGWPRWYWGWSDGVPRDVTWHGPFMSEWACQSNAARY